MVGPTDVEFVLQCVAVCCSVLRKYIILAATRQSCYSECKVWHDFTDVEFVTFENSLIVFVMIAEDYTVLSMYVYI